MDGVHPSVGLAVGNAISRTHDHGISWLHALFMHMLYRATALATFQLTWHYGVDNLAGNAQ
jgi:hypothetical protein